MNGSAFSFLMDKGEETLLATYIQPRAGKSGFAGVFQDRLKIRICSPPVEGEANRECIQLLAKVIDIAKSEIKLIRGGQSRQKTFLISRPIEFVRLKLEKAGLGADVG